MRLTDKQDEMVRALQAARTTYDKKLANIEAVYIASKETAKNPIRELVGKAEEAGVPKRQIHLAVGFAQVTSLRSFLLPSAKVGAASFYTDLYGAAGEQVEPALAVIKPEVELRLHQQMVYWFEDGVEKNTSRQVMGHAEDGRAVFKLNFSQFPNLDPAVQEAILDSEGAIHLSTDEELNEYFGQGNLPVRYQL